MDYEKVYNKYKPKLTKLFSSKVNDLDTAEDLTQDTLIRVYEKIGTYNDEYALSTWIYTIAFNILADHYRSSSRSPDISFSPEVYDNEYTESTASPENILIAHQQKQTVVDTLAKLNKDTLEAYMLKDMSNLSYEDISSQLNTPVNTIKSRVKRARDTLAKALDKDNK